MNTEDSHQRAKRLETKLQKAINRLSRRLETSQRDRKVDDATLDPSAAPDLAVLGRPIICPNTDTTLAVGNFHHVFTSWHFLATFSNELGIGVSQDAIYNAHRHATAQKDRAILNAGPVELARRIYGATIDPCGAGTSQEDGFLGRIHRALLRLLITDSTVNLWWPDVKVSHEPIATIPSATQLPPAASDGASKRIRAMAARVKLDTEAILKCAADEPEEITQLWLEMLEGIRHLRTNSGNPIRDVILGVLEITKNAAVQQFLKSCLSWWRCNAAGTTKHTALQVLNFMRFRRANSCPIGTASNEFGTSSVKSSLDNVYSWNFESQACGNFCSFSQL
jgi:hypothetical protein